MLYFVVPAKILKTSNDRPSPLQLPLALDQLKLFVKSGTSITHPSNISGLEPALIVYFPAYLPIQAGMLTDGRATAGLMLLLLCCIVGDCHSENNVSFKNLEWL